MASTLKKRIKLLMTRHLPSGEPNVFIHSMPRSGSTWLMELILTQPGFASYNEPLNLEKEGVRDNLGVSEWADLHKAGFIDKLGPYIEALCSGSLRDSRFNRPSPFSPFYRAKTRRIVFKFIHGGEEYINWMAESFNGGVLYLVRHPVPVALSRKYTRQLNTILDTEFSQFLTESQLRVAKDVTSSDDQFARRVLDWCLWNSIALRSRTDDWVVLTYEQLVVNPNPAVDHIADRLALPKPDRILKRLSVPSRSTNLSNPDTQEVLRDKRDVAGKQWLVEKWINKVSEEELAVASELLDVFGLSEIYSVSAALPNESYWI